MIYYGAKMDVVQFATKLQLLSEEVWPLITVTKLGSSEVYSVSGVINMLSEDTVEKLAQTYSLRPTNTSPVTIPAIRSLRKPK